MIIELNGVEVKEKLRTQSDFLGRFRSPKLFRDQSNRVGCFSKNFQRAQ